MSALAPRCALVFLLAAFIPHATAEPPVIPDGPTTIDPTQFLPAPLRAKVTADFTESSLRELVAWLRDEQGLSVVVHEREILDELDVSLSDRVSDQLNDAPLYQLLNSLSQLDLAWWYEGGVLHLATAETASERLELITYSLSELIDAGYQVDSVVDTITATISADTWTVNGGGDAEIRPIGDVLFVTQTADTQREIAALLQGLRGHGRQTRLNDPLEHQELREKLEQPVTADFDGTPLVEAVADFARQVDADLRLDRPALRSLGLREREPIRLQLTGSTLKMALKAMLSDLELTSSLRDGVLWITSEEEIQTQHQVAIYDVRDLCRDPKETHALIDAITSQVAADTWAANGGGDAEIISAKTGALVVAQPERTHLAIFRLLEMYREALRNSKPRERETEDDPNEVITVYYRLHRETAEEAVDLLPSLTTSEAWEDDAAIHCVASDPKYVTTQKGAAPVERSFSVLIVRQKRSIHDEIREVLGRIAGGDPAPGSGGGGFGGGGGGFGGGFFSVEQEKASPK